MNGYALRGRVCEEPVTEPVNSCLRCDGPTDVAYDWYVLRGTLTRAQTEADPHSVWRYAALLPGAAQLDFGAGWTPLVHTERLSELLGLELLLNLESSNPTHSFKDQLATVAAQAAHEHGISTLCCSSTGNLGDAVAAAAAAAGLDAIILTPRQSATAQVEPAHPELE